MILCIMESPYAGDVERNLTYARECLYELLEKGYAPIASHLLYTQVLDDEEPEQRALGIQAGLAWRRVAPLSVFCVRYGWSRGMLAALESAKLEGHPFIVIHEGDV